MKSIYRSLNTIAHFNELNQGLHEYLWYLCTLFAPAVNLKYNCWITLTKEDLMVIAKKQVLKWLLRLDYGWSGEDWVNAIYDFVVENALHRGWKIPNLKVFKRYDKEQYEWIDRGYMIMIWMWVNESFKSDILDWKLDLFDDYNEYRWTKLKHFTNLTKWKDRFWNKTKNFNREFFVDSYAYNKKGNKWIYDCNLEKVLETFAYNTRYIFY